MAAMILSDVVATITMMGPDDGTAGTAVGSALTVCLDKVSVSQTRELVDTSCNQSATPHKRTSKLSWSIDVETKLQGTLLADLQSANAVIVTFAMTSDNHDLSGTGIIESINVEYGNPSTLSFKIAEYGSALTIVAGS